MSKRRRLVRRSESLVNVQAGTEDYGILIEDNKGDTKHRETLEWLRSLSLPTAQAVYNLMKSSLKPTSISQVPDPEREKLATLAASSYTSGRDGAWYTSWSTCEVIATTTNTISHPRWQVDVTAGPNSIGGKLKAVLPIGAWEALISLLGGKRQWKVQIAGAVGVFLIRATNGVV
ncbi:uncharacterized protein BP5553_04378 [Venustampulla echinocandica]|uniref:Uncharacterized protein n=1 Tax=Venustampulla echinocandica TaxID=2656787 RepID=A0A370TN53_9HELO|nr:uncharacterized protein BP5553_04378 [Venustampulla echinocandica]RDL36945.1 hypothetical protein BP5553_04378 [Venustampulla echinocandica]